MAKHPNVVFVFSDQHRAEATGYAGNPDVMTPNLDRLKSQSVHFTRAVSNIPCCAPYRGTLLTGRYPLTHGVFVNDVHLNHDAVSIADAYRQVGYDTAYIGKWHVNGRGRSSFIPKEDRQGFDYWQVLECTHNYNQSYFYDNDDELKVWEGYDAQAQTDSAIDYIRGRKGNETPFLLVLSWGPPHNPYETAPQPFRDMYDRKSLTLRPNVPEELKAKAAQELSGYYAHITALDGYVGGIWQTLREQGIEDDTIFVYASDHGDMLHSQGEFRKQRPWDESILVPFLLHYPAQFGREAIEVSKPFNSPDIMPTLLGLSHVPIPDTVEGHDFAPFLRGEEDLNVNCALIECIQPSGEYSKAVGGREYRGIRTDRYTFVRDLNGPWLLYDNDTDPYQLQNLCNQPDYAHLQADLDAMLMDQLVEQNDEFLPGEAYIKKWGYEVDETGTVPYQW